jgi:hypothetical protein
MCPEAPRKTLCWKVREELVNNNLVVPVTALQRAAVAQTNSMERAPGTSTGRGAYMLPQSGLKRL